MPRKAAPTDPDRRQPFNVPATPALREKVLRAAEKSGRSISRELEFRLENSFARDEVIQLLLGGSENGRLLERVSAILRDAGNWREDDKAVQSVIDDVMDAIQRDAKAHRAGKQT